MLHKLARKHIVGSPSAKRAWIEIHKEMGHAVSMGSPSAKRAWIEIFAYVDVPCGCCVALCEEGVDRNRSAADMPGNMDVALYEEGVDRNKARARLRSQ